MAKPSKPNPMDPPFFTEVLRHEIALHWKAPRSCGSPEQRYDVVGGPCIRQLRWAAITFRMLNQTVDLDRMGPSDEVIVGDMLGQEHMADLVCDELVYAPADGKTFETRLVGLLPGQSYYFMVRALNHVGRGDFSEILGPITTPGERPCRPMDAACAAFSHQDCTLCVQLPFDSGGQIDRMRLNIQRLAGPLSSDEQDEHGNAKAHLCSRELLFDRAAIAIAQPWEGPEPGPMAPRWRPGVTPVIQRCYEHEGLDEIAMRRNSLPPTRSLVTGRTYLLAVDGLQPGSRYDVHWACQNEYGWSPASGAITIHTEGTVPDVPDLITVHGI